MKEAERQTFFVNFNMIVFFRYLLYTLTKNFSKKLETRASHF